MGIVDYPALNEATKRFAEELAGTLDRHTVALGLSRDDLFDMFTHWLVAVKRYPFGDTQYWKIAPGEQAMCWRDWLEGGYASVGWDAIGDVSAMNREQFLAAQKNAVATHEDYKESGGSGQLWVFAREVREGDRLIANRGKSEMIGVGTVTGPYYHVPGVEHTHRIPVEWDDTAVRRLPEPNHAWMRTLLSLTRKEFEDLLSVGPIEDVALGEPFNELFADRAEADWAFNLLKHILERLGCEGSADERFVFTYGSSRRKVRLGMGGWLIADFRAPKEGKPLRLALLLDDAGVSGPPSYTFATNEGGPACGLVSMTFDEFRADGQLQGAFDRTLDFVRDRYSGWQRSNFRKHHHSELLGAVIDPDVRERLLTGGRGSVGVWPEIPPTPGTPGPFTETTFALLEGLAGDPTKVFYGANKDALQVSVEAPFQELFRRVAQQLPEPIRAAMETEKSIFGRIPKNDWGRGGAWPFYWGAFYPKGSKRTEDSQLFAFLDYSGLAFGFAVGNYGSEQRKRFAYQGGQHRSALVSIFGDSLAELGVGFGEENVGKHSLTPEGEEELSLGDWLKGSPGSAPQAQVLLAPNEVLRLGIHALAERIVQTFAAVFPFVLLATDDDPLPLIRQYLEEGSAGPEETELNPEYPLSEMAAETGFDIEELERWARAVERKGQAVLYGPPGTGKTFVAERLAQHLIGGDDGFSELVQFHPAYAYEDFMQGIRPRAREDGQLEYPLVKGRFFDFCDKAKTRTGTCVLIIDEINRANLARVFGELMYLLEYRQAQVPLAGGRTFSIPANVRLIGTMNTADRSIALVDHALRRRFAFLGLYPDYDVLTRYHERHGTGYDVAPLVDLLKDLNRRIADRHYEVGISFFMREDLQGQLPDIWRMEIEPYLEEYFFDQKATMEKFRWAEVKPRLEKAQPES